MLQPVRVIYLSRRDTNAEACELVRACTGAAQVWLVMPWRNRVISGRLDVRRLRHVAERAELGEKREAILAVTIPERPGSFKKFCSLLGKRSITEFNYRIADPKVAQLLKSLKSIFC